MTLHQLTSPVEYNPTEDAFYERIEREIEQNNRRILKMKTKLPESAEEMPIAFHNGDDQSLRNCLMSLDTFRAVNINWEMDIKATQATGESCGEWTVDIHTHRRTFTAKHSELTNALWFAHTLADAAYTEAYEQRESARNAALAKLSPEERKALGIR